jgi:plasmid replication initiation protein
MEDIAQHGRDNMNLAEIPITLLADRVPKGVTTLVFNTEHGRLTVSGSSDYGLPLAVDGDIIVALLYLTKRANDFTDPTVNFTKHEIIELLRWKKSGGNYQRIADGLNRWVGVTLRYDGCWYDNAIKRKGDASFHILESVVTYDSEVRAHAKTLQCDLPFGQFSWNKIFFESCRASYVKKLDINTYFSLNSSISRQMMRFLDKRFYVRKDLTFGLRQFAFENVGLSRKYADDQIRKKLKPALDELISVGVLKSFEFISVRRGVWHIRVVAGTKAGDGGGRRERLLGNMH